MKHSGRAESFHMLQAGRSERKSTALPPRCIRTHMFADHPQGASRNRADGWAPSISAAAGECVLKREFSEPFITLLNSHASRATGATKPRVLLMSGSLSERRLPL